jgi:hypothetical protein
VCVSLLIAGRELAPDREQLLTQQGGCLAFDGQTVIFRHADSGILKYADENQLAGAVLPGGAPAAASQTARTLF